MESTQALCPEILLKFDYEEMTIYSLTKGLTQSPVPTLYSLDIELPGIQL